MHIVYVQVPFGGPEACSLTLLPWLEAQGHKVSVVYTVPPHVRKSPYPASVSVHYAPPGNVHYHASRLKLGGAGLPKVVRAYEQQVAVARALRRIERERSIDVVEVTEGLPVDLLVKTWKVALRAHGSDWSFRIFCDGGSAPGDDRLIELQRKQMQRSHAVGAISRHTADHISHFCRFPRECIHHLPYPIGDDWLVDNRLPEPNNRSVMAVGRLEHRKGTDTAIRAMRRVWEHLPDVRIYLAGLESQYSKDDIRSMVQPERRDQIVFLGFIARDELRRYYRTCTAYVAPSQYETFGYTILEAMAHGLPVVSTNSGAIPELVEDGVNGRLTEFDADLAVGEAIITMFSEPDVTARMGQASYQKAAGYQLDNVGPLLLRFYEQAISGRSVASHAEVG